jgi:hypothetical protein
MKRLTLKHIEPISFANFVAIFSAFVTFVIVVVEVFAIWLKIIQVNTLFPNATFHWGTAIWDIIVYTIVALITGWIWGVVAAWFYNVALAETKGIKFEIKEENIRLNEDNLD